MHIAGHTEKTTNQTEIILTLTPNIIRVLDLTDAADVGKTGNRREDVAAICASLQAASTAAAWPNSSAMRNR